MLSFAPSILLIVGQEFAWLYQAVPAAFVGAWLCGGSALRAWYGEGDEGMGNYHQFAAAIFLAQGLYGAWILVQFPLGVS